MTTQAAGPSGAADDLDLFEAEATGQPRQTKIENKPTTIPDKYAGKSVDDLISMHQNAERKISEQGQEVARVRRLADQLLELKKPPESTTAKKEEPRPPVTVETLLNDPEKALTSAVESSEVARRAAAAEARVDQLERNITQRDFVSKHANFEQDLQNPEFTSWVKANPVRAALGGRAAQNDFEAASHLWDMWEERKALTSVASTTKDDKGEARAPKKGLSTIKSSPSSNGEMAAPIYSRAKLIELRMRVADGDPAAVARWSDPTFQERMHQAYAEERVR